MFGGIYLYIFQPYITFSEVRISNTPVEIKVVYVNVTGDPLCAKLYSLGSIKDNKPVATKEVFYLAMPDGIPSPEDGDLAVSDNMFLIKGYRYRLIEKNNLTGDSTKSPSHRFDVISWKVMLPYERWKDTVSLDGAVEKEIATDSVSYTFNKADHDPGIFIKGNNIDCLR